MADGNVERLSARLKLRVVESAAERTGSAYLVDGDIVWMCGLGGPVPLSERSREELLNIFVREDAARAFLALHDAHVKAGGIERCSPFRPEPDAA